MEAVIYRKFGPPSVLEVVQDYPVPERRAGQVLVKVHAVGVNPVDIATRLGSIPIAKKEKVE
jgi:NADPH:quinone reductase-like Zn-dependent oxidoreductase